MYYKYTYTHVLQKRCYLKFNGITISDVAGYEHIYFDCTEVPEEGYEHISLSCTEGRAAVG